MPLTPSFVMHWQLNTKSINCVTIHWHICKRRRFGGPGLLPWEFNLFIAFIPLSVVSLLSWFSTMVYFQAMPKKKSNFNYFYLVKWRNCLLKYEIKRSPPQAITKWKMNHMTSKTDSVILLGRTSLIISSQTFIIFVYGWYVHFEYYWEEVSSLF